MSLGTVGKSYGSFVVNGRVERARHSGWVLIEIPEPEPCGYTEIDTPSFLWCALKLAW